MTHRTGVPGDRHLPRRRYGRTLIEVLVVLGILLLLLAMLIPRLEHAREQFRRIVCKNNLRQWGVAAQYYRDDNDDYLPTEGTYLESDKPYTWFNALPPYLDAPPYRVVEGVGDAIKEYPGLHVWICPSKNLSHLYKSGSGKNQIHYGMNAVLDGMNSSLTPDFPDQGDAPIRAQVFAKRPHTVFMFDIYPNAYHGHPGDVATSFHKNYANVVYLSGAVADFQAEDFVTDGDFVNGDVIWTHPKLDWGYRPPAE